MHQGCSFRNATVTQHVVARLGVQPLRRPLDGLSTAAHISNLLGRPCITLRQTWLKRTQRGTQSPIFSCGRCRDDSSKTGFIVTFHIDFTSILTPHSYGFRHKGANEHNRRSCSGNCSSLRYIWSKWWTRHPACESEACRWTQLGCRSRATAFRFSE